MGIVDRIRENFEELTKSERKIATYFLGHQNDCVFYTLERLSEEIGVSTTSVIRFARRIGFAGFKPFQEALRENLRLRQDLPDKFQNTLGHAAGELWTQTVNADMECLRKTFEGMPPEDLMTAVRLIAEAPRVYTFGMKESFALSHYAYTRLITVRGNVFLLNAGINGSVEPLLSLGEGDVCLVFLFHRYTKQALALLPLLRQRTKQVILVTSDPTDGVSEYASVLLKCAVNAGGIKNSSAAPVFLCDYLCNAVAVHDGEKSLAYMKQTEELFRESSMISL